MNPYDRLYAWRNAFLSYNGWMLGGTTVVRLGCMRRNGLYMTLLERVAHTPFAGVVNSSTGPIFGHGRFSTVGGFMCAGKGAKEVYPELKASSGLFRP